MIRYIMIMLLLPSWLVAQELKIFPSSKAIDDWNCTSDNQYDISELDSLLRPNKNFTKIESWSKNDWDLEKIEWYAKENLSQYWMDPDNYADDYKAWLIYLFDEKQFALSPHRSNEDNFKKFAEHLLPLYYGYHALNTNGHLSPDEKDLLLSMIKIRSENLFNFIKNKNRHIYDLSKCGSKDIWTCNNGAYKLQLVRTLYGATFNDNAHYDQGKKIFEIAIDGLSDDGALWREASRSKWSWMYYTSGLNLLISIADIYYLNGENLYDYVSPNGNSIHSAVQFLSEAIDDNEKMWKYAKTTKGVNHYDDWKNYKDTEHLDVLKFNGVDGYNAWFYIYATRYRDALVTKKLMSQIQLGDKIQWGYIGFDTHCFYPVENEYGSN